VRGFANANPDFPHQSTIDQWFTESQFESYRRSVSRSPTASCAAPSMIPPAASKRRSRRFSRRWGKIAPAGPRTSTEALMDGRANAFALLRAPRRRSVRLGVDSRRSLDASAATAGTACAAAIGLIHGAVVASDHASER
jgi:hypothetical protein